MAANTVQQEVRVEETLKIRIGEAKNLLPRKEPRSGRNSYCVVSLDQEQIFRTATVEKSLNPFFGEDVHFEVPRDFRSLCFYVYDTDLIRKDTVLGKVAIKKEDLQKFHSDTWFDLVHVHADTEVQGRIHLDIKHFDGIPDLNEEEISSTPKLRVRIKECSDIFACSGGGTFSDSFVTVTVLNPPSRSEIRKTRVKKKTVNPQFDESFLFEIPYDDLEETVVRCAVWSSTLLGEDVFLGEVRIPLSKCDLTTTHEGWYWLGPREDRRSSISQQSIGSLRVRICYSEDHVFPSTHYDPLREAILEVHNHTDVTTTPSFILSEIVKDKLSAARSLVRVFSHHNRVVEFVKSIVDYEVETTTDPNTLFRGNSLATKAVDEFMKHAGMQYLHETIKHLVDEIFEERKNCEIDPSRLRDGQSLETNLANLQGYVDKLFTAITSSAIACPTIMCQVFFTIKDSAVQKFPDEPDVRYTAVSGFVFLRFFAPAILNPKLFQMRSEHPDPLTARTLTLASKAIQSLGNLVSSVFCGQVKEPYMENLKSMILDEKHIFAIKGFLDAISSSPLDSQGLPVDYQIVLKEGYLIKRAQGRSRFGFKNYKKRFFVLTNQGLSYYKTKGKAPLSTIPSDDIKGVERLGEESFKYKLMFQILQPDKPLYIQAYNSVEEREWISALRKLCQSTSSDKLERFHPEAYVCGRWLCCKERTEKAEGCQPVTEIPQPKCINVAIDCDREIERIHSLFLVNLERLDELQVEWESKYESSEGDERHYCKAKLESINIIRSHVISLEQDHKQYRKITHRLTRHGSKKCPWGPTQEALDPIRHVTL